MPFGPEINWTISASAAQARGPLTDGFMGTDHQLRMGRRRGFIGTMLAISREMDRANRRAERSARQQHRRLVAAMQAQARMMEEERARHESAVFENTLARLSSVHRECAFTIDWVAIANTPEPERRQVDGSKTSRLEAALASYRQNWLERLFRTTWRRQRIESKLAAARAEQAAAEERAKTDHEKATREWQEARDTAKEMLAGNVETYEDAVADTNCLGELEELGCSPRVYYPSSSVAQITVQVSESSVVPAEEKSVSARGKLLSKKMPATRRQDIHQDYACGAVLRGARELFAVLPVKAVLAHAEMEMLNSSTGHLTRQTIISVFCPRATFDAINWEAVDASDLVSRLHHRMTFKKGKGFAPVEPLSAFAIPLIAAEAIH